MQQKGFKKTFNCDLSHDIVPSPRAIRPPIHDSMQHKPHQRSILPPPLKTAPVQLTAHSSKAPRAPPEPTKKPAQASGSNGVELPPVDLYADRRGPKGLMLIHWGLGPSICRLALFGEVLGKLGWMELVEHQLSCRLDAQPGAAKVGNNTSRVL